MRNETRLTYNAMILAMAKTYGIPSARQKFAVSEPIETRLNDAIQESDDFLSRITVAPVTDMKGQALTIAIPTTVAGRTDTSGGARRNPQIATGPTGQQYEVKHTDFDIAIPYSLLDMWARFPDFRQRYMNAIYRRIALDRIMVGWWGTSVAADTDRETHPDLSDVNVGWLYLLETINAANYMTEGVAESERINLCPDGDFENLDQMVYSIWSMIDRAHRTGREVAIIGQELITRETGKVLAEHAQTPTEKNAIRTLDKSYGGLPSVIVPHFPDCGVLVTDLKNLHLYWQASAMRRHAKDEPEYNRVADYISSNEAYFFGDFEGAAGLLSDNVFFELPAGE